MKLNKSNILNLQLRSFYWIIVSTYVLAVFVQSISIVYVSSILLILVEVSSLSYRKFKLHVDIYLLYFILLLASGLMYFFNDISLELFFTGIAYSLLPMVLFFAPKEEPDRILDYTFNALIVSMVAGALFYFWAPSFYGEYLAYHNYLQFAHQVKKSFQGLYGITSLGTYSACCTIFFFGKWLRKFNKYDIIKAIISLLVLFATMRRSAVAACLIMFLIENLVFLRRFKENRRKHLIVIIIFIITMLGALLIYSNTIFSTLSRVANVRVAVSERSGNWVLNLAEVKNHLFGGTGLGSAGHLASAAGYVGVHDNSYLLIVRENGVLGIILFAGMIIKSLFAFTKISNKSFYNYISIFVIFIFMIQAIGSNVWEFPLLGSLFWICLSTMNCTYEAHNSIEFQSKRDRDCVCEK